MIPLSLGEMLELGHDSDAEHRAVGEYTGAKLFQYGIAVGRC